MFLSSTMKTKHLCLIFGAVPAVVDRAIENTVPLLISILENHEASKIQFPTEDRLEYLASLVEMREPSVKDVALFADGLSIPVMCSDDEESQAADYNGYYHDTHCNNVFLFGPDGKIYSASINYPGSWHDSQVCQLMIVIVLLLIGLYKVCVDQGFPRSGELFDKFVGPISRRSLRKLSPIVKDLLIERSNIYVSLRQSSEWGMRSLQGSFSRLKSRLSSNKPWRHSVILCIVLLHNFRTEYVGLNQIATVFNPHYEQSINIYGYDRIARYYNQVD